ncbi:MAG: endonuclease [Bacteroidetes bacterium HGW-Bacteroidetes-5]|nr:MAG: endonuclease [Bacteroidetes bacterium HGW-Bacteroidetes-5]
MNLVKVGRREKGSAAEDLALEFLLKRGMVLLGRNWRVGHKELDLLMKSTNEATEEQRLHVIEVRSLSEPNLQLPFETVDIKKQRAVISAASAYIYRNQIMCETQFDIVSVLFEKDGNIRIDYLPEAFNPKW